MSKVGFIGLGIMGRPMATNLVKAGQDVMVSDLNADIVKELCAMGATSGTYTEIARECDLILTILPPVPSAGRCCSVRTAWPPP